MLHAILAVLGALTGGAIADEEGVLAGLIVGLLSASVIRLTGRVGRLEQTLAALEKPAVGHDTEDSTLTTPVEPVAPAPVVATPSKPANTRVAPDLGGDHDLDFDIDFDDLSAASPTPVAPARTTPAATPEMPARKVQTPSPFEGVARSVKAFFTGGNVVVRVGLIILFFGVAFALRYAVERDVFPIELRLAAIAAGALAMFVVGWRLRVQKLGYGLMLQGGAVGILYLTVFSAAQHYELISLAAAFAFMVALAAITAALAVLQNAKSLATMGAIGGFLAPLLGSSGSGDHITLFSYYAILNAGIFAVAWFKAWRSLNFVAFLFTFVVATAWGALRYQSSHFETTEPFLILFFLYFVGISVLYALRQPPRLKGLVDSTLVFGTPLVCFGLQTQLVRDIDFALAYSALGMGALYVALAALLWRLKIDGMRLLVEAFLALGVIFTSLAVPLAFDGHWTAVTWALEGAAMVWVGVRQRRTLARVFGLMLQLGAGGAFLLSIEHPISGETFIDSNLLGAILIALSGAVTSYVLDKYRDGIAAWERGLSAPTLVWALLWWFGAGLNEIFEHNFANRNALLTVCLALFVSTFAVFAKLSSWLKWSALRYPVLILLPIAALIAVAETFGPRGSHILSDWGWLVWPAMLALQYWVMHRHQQHWSPALSKLWQLGTYWLVVYIVCAEVTWLFDDNFNDTWTMAALGATLCAAVLGTLWLLKRSVWPLREYETEFLGAGLEVVCATLSLWLVWACLYDGNPAPLAYFPVLNPLDLVSLLALICIWRWFAQARNEGLVFMTDLPRSIPFSILGSLAFMWVNAAIARSVHTWTGVRYQIDALHHSLAFQSSIAIVWTLLSLGLMVLATRLKNRRTWIVGAVLLGGVIFKLFVVDLSGTGTVARIVSFLAVGVLMLVIGYFSPLPPKQPRDGE